MDMRTQGKEFDYARQRARNKGIRFVRSRFGSIVRQDDRLEMAYVDDSGQHHREQFDLVVLPEGLELPQDAQALAQAAGIELNHYDFGRTSTFAPLETTRPGVFVAGAFQAPKDVPESVTDASGAAALAAKALQAARGTQVETKTYPPEVEPVEESRIGVFVCACGTNIGGVVDVPAVADYATTLDNVVFVDTNLYSCAQGTQELITEKIRVQGLNGVVVAACTPRTHEPLFQETLKNAGLNACLFEMANIRDHCSWVHARERTSATEKAKDLVRMAVAKAQWLTPLPEQRLPVIPRALVIGGGLAGMTAALNIADQGFQTYLIKKMNNWGAISRVCGRGLRPLGPAPGLRTGDHPVSPHPGRDAGLPGRSGKRPARGY
jgi:heterodisulfide reductase subunit A